MSAVAAAEHQAFNDHIESARTAALPDADLVADYRRYVLGDHPLTLSPGMKADLGSLLRAQSSDKSRYTDNLCRLAVTTAADYLSLARIEIDSDSEADRAALEAFIGALWAYNQIPELEAKANVAAYRDGNHAIGLEWDAANERVRLFTLPWWNGKSGTFIHYGRGNLPDWAVDEWAETVEGKLVGRREVWFPDRVQRYRRVEGGNWEPYRLQSDGDQWPYPHTFDGTPNGEPVGIPRVHFPLYLVPNDAPGTGSAEADSRYGLSLLSGGALGVQDALNDAHYDLIVGARRTAFPVYTATGVALRPDPERPGHFIPLQTGPGSLLNSESPNARFGILTPGDMGQLFNVISGHTRVFARLTNTPMQIVNEEGTDAQSGVALFRMQLSAVRQARRTQTVFSYRWGMVAHKATVMAKAFGKADLNTDIPLVGAYDPIEASDLATLAEVAQALTLAGFPLEFVLEKFGETTENVQRIMGMRQAERSANADAQAKAFNAGNDSVNTGGL